MIAAPRIFIWLPVSVVCRSRTSNMAFPLARVLAMADVAPWVPPVARRSASRCASGKFPRGFAFARRNEMKGDHMHWTDRRRRFRALLAGDRCVHPGSVFDPISARIAEDLGFEVGMFAGSVASLTVLGAPDLIVLTLSEFAAQAFRLHTAGNLPPLAAA